jgi:hypothetical protein
MSQMARSSSLMSTEAQLRNLAARYEAHAKTQQTEQVTLTPQGARQEAAAAQGRASSEGGAWFRQLRVRWPRRWSKA